MFLPFFILAIFLFRMGDAFLTFISGFSRSNWPKFLKRTVSMRQINDREEILEDEYEVFSVKRQNRPNQTLPEISWLL